MATRSPAIIRCSRADVRNPVLTLPAIAALRALPPEIRTGLAAVLDDLRADAAVRAERSWRQRKAPMAAYWRAVSVYSRHIARALRRP